MVHQILPDASGTASRKLVSVFVHQVCRAPNLLLLIMKHYLKRKGGIGIGAIRIENNRYNTIVFFSP
jgi:hypothetical protein